MVTRRCYERRFFLRPDPATTNMFWYVLGWAAKKHNIGLVSACALSNHYHLTVIDYDGRYPDFLRDFNALLARGINALRKRWEAVWTNRQTSMVRLIDEGAQLGKVVYTLINPVKDHLVERVADWPGATAIAAIRTGKPIIATRPKHFFRNENDDGKMPETVSINFVVPPAFGGRREEYLERLEASIAALESKAARVRRTERRKAMGARKVLAQHWDDRPSSPEPRRQLNPRVASTDKWARIEAINRNKLFDALYRYAFGDHRAGKRAVFPAGTWLMAKFHAVAVAQP